MAVQAKRQVGRDDACIARHHAGEQEPRPAAREPRETAADRAGASRGNVFHVDADRDGDAERGNRGDFGRRGGQSAQSRERTAGRGIVFRGVWKMGKPGAERGIGGNAARAFSRQFSASPPKRRQGVTTNLRGVQSDALRRIPEPRECVELSNQLAGFGARAKKRKRGNREAFLRHDRFVAQELDPEVLENRGYRGVSADHVRGSVASNNRGIRMVLAGI